MPFFLPKFSKGSSSAIKDTEPEEINCEIFSSDWQKTTGFRGLVVFVFC